MLRRIDRQSDANRFQRWSVKADAWATVIAIIVRRYLLAWPLSGGIALNAFLKFAPRSTRASHWAFLRWIAANSKSVRLRWVLASGPDRLDGRYAGAGTSEDSPIIKSQAQAVARVPCFPCKFEYGNVPIRFRKAVKALLIMVMRLGTQTLVAKPKHAAHALLLTPTARSLV